MKGRLYLLLTTVASLVSEEATLLAEKVKYFNPEVFLIWLIFSMAMFEFGAIFLEPVDPDNIYSWLSLSFTSFFFLGISIVFGIYGLIKNVKKR